MGFAIAHAVIGDPALNAFDLHRAETSFELTYQARISRRFVIQPDIDYVRRPAGPSDAPDSVGVGLRIVYVTAYPVRMTASDPTVPPDGSPPATEEASDR